MSTETFSGSVPENYQRHLVPLIFEDYAHDLASRVPPGRVLETACGTGVLTRKLLAAGNQVIATDLNEPMLEVARSGSAQAEFQVADATDLPFPDAQFDAVACQFGVMFFPDVCRGYQEARRVLKPEGIFAFNIWDSLANNPFKDVAHRALAAALPDDPPTFLEIPFGYTDLRLIKDQLQSSGFGEVQMSVLPRPCRAASARDVAIALANGSPVGPEATEKGLADGGVEVIQHALTQAFGSGPIEALMQAIVIVARPA